MRNYYKYNVYQFFKHFKGRLIAFAVFASILIFMTVNYPKVKYYDSPNTSRVYGEKRVFDFGDQLSDSEEESLENYIHKAEKKICCDIVIVTLNESLKNFEPDYMNAYDMFISPDKYVMVYADWFWENNKFGYDGPQVLDGTDRTGDGVILVDNVYREDETGKIYTWMGTTGKCEREYSDYEIDRALDVFYEDVEEEYYNACKAYVDRVVKDMGGGSIMFTIVPIVLTLIVTLVYISTNIKPTEGVITVTPRTYLEGGHEEFYNKEDVFVRSAVTKVYDPPSSSSGGGGSHSSGGGGSHGGGGHSR